MYFPGRTLPSRDELDAAVERGELVRRWDVYGNQLYMYTRDTFYAGFTGEWSSVACEARGLVLAPDGKVLCLPFPKFFNVGENERYLPNHLPSERLRGSDKLDGSMIAVWHDGHRWRSSTKGAFDSPQAAWGLAWLERVRGLDRLDPYRRKTLLFEAIYPRGTFEDDLFVDYGDREDMVLLTVYDCQRVAELRPEVVDRIAEYLGVRRPEVFEFSSVEEVLACAKDLGVDREGFVVQFLESGLRVKVKGERYRRGVKALAGSTLLGFWEGMGSNGKVDPELIECIPADRRDDIMPIITDLEYQFRFVMNIALRLSQEARAIPEGRERAAWVKSRDPLLTHVLFALLSGQDERAGETVCRLLRPTNNQISEAFVQLRARYDGTI